jgi:hypothetical protein
LGRETDQGVDRYDNGKKITSRIRRVLVYTYGRGPEIQVRPSSIQM